ncbi:Mitochondrial distribution and morphology protein 31, mitochondrial precursor [Maudiozyma exigua]|uniref:Mitochondrial distribution and morphology protein 31, mitochondrial n=1 Tax=Maudiozyma exigua TaxID=34358 RepID=A0A9P6WCK5_MAUEX|nr:Mitochondrial distribution and morphology protein 31, mitochondrial precursor [Kazachstania exigua]
MNLSKTHIQRIITSSSNFIGIRPLRPLTAIRSSFITLSRHGYVNSTNNSLIYKRFLSSEQEKIATTNRKIRENLIYKRRLNERNRLLEETENIWGRLKIRLRWFLKKSTNPFNTDDIGALISWILVSHVLVFIIWTTTFVSLIIYLMNTVFAQEYLAKKIGKLITSNNNLTVIFENAIVPSWSSGKITINKVFVSRRPYGEDDTFNKGSQQDAMQRATLALSENLLVSRDDFEEGNYTQFDLTIEEVQVSLSFTKWINGKGFIDELSINGLRGVVDRTHLVWKANDDPRNYKNVYHVGDLEIAKFVMNDALVTLYQPNGFRPFQVSIFNCELPQLRKHWLFYDILNANSISGTYDNSMFTIHRRLRFNENDTKSRIVTQLRIDNLDIDHLNASMEGPFGWIEEGSVDMVADIFLPDEANSGVDSFALPELISDVSNKILKRSNSKEDEIISTKNLNNLNYRKLDPNEYFVMDFYLKLNNIRAQVPLFTNELTYTNNALIRPIVAYMNSRRTYIPIKCMVVKKKSDFEGCWTIYDSYLMNDLSAEVYDAFADYVSDERRQSIRVKKVAFWSLQLLLQLILMGLGAIA